MAKANQPGVLLVLTSRAEAGEISLESSSYWQFHLKGEENLEKISLGFFWGWKFLEKISHARFTGRYFSLATSIPNTGNPALEVIRFTGRYFSLATSIPNIGNPALEVICCTGKSGFGREDLQRKFFHLVFEGTPEVRARHHSKPTTH